MYGLNPFAQGIDPIELLKVKGLLGNTFAQPPMAPQPMQQMAQAAPEPPPMVAPQGQQVLPPMDIGSPPQPEQPPMQVPMPPRRPDSFGPQGGLPSLVGQPMPNMGPESATPEQRQMAASSAGKPQDVRPDGTVGFDAGLDKMMSDPLFHMGVALLANPRNPGQGLASGLQNWGTASRQAKRERLAEEASKRKNIHWFMRPDGTLAGVNADDPTQLVVPPGQTPKNTEGAILQAGQEGVPQGFIGVKNPGGNISLHPLPQSPEQKLETIGQEAKVREEAKVNTANAAAEAKAQAKMAADRQKAQQTFADTLPVYNRALDAYERAAKAGAIGPFASGGLMRGAGALAGSEAENARQEYEKSLAELKLRKSQEFMRGQGAISDKERAMLGDLFPGLNASDPEVGIRFLRYQRDLAKRRAAGDWSPFDPQEQQQSRGSGSVQSAPQIGVGESKDFGGVKIRRVR